MPESYQSFTFHAESSGCVIYSRRWAGVPAVRRACRGFDDIKSAIFGSSFLLIMTGLT